VVAGGPLVSLADVAGCDERHGQAIRRRCESRIGGTRV
jgi:hypothetical protein